MKWLERLWDGFTSGLIVGIGLTGVLVTALALWANRCLPGQADLVIDGRDIAPLRCTVDYPALTLWSPSQPGYALHLVEERHHGWRAELVRPTGVTALPVEGCDTLDVRMRQPGTEYAEGKLVVECDGVAGRVNLEVCK